jgi:DNA mismatch endonuclease (patch repair protein)
VARDHRNKEALEKLGWRVLTVWECETKAKAEDFLRVLLTSILGEVRLRTGALKREQSITKA